jgi:hypothetical protein
MAVTEGNVRLRKLIDHIIEDGIITHAEYESIMRLVHEDLHIDNQEKAMISELQKMIENNMIKRKG